VDLSALRPDSPGLLHSRRPDAPPLAIILATVHATIRRTPSPDEALSWIPTAVRAVLTTAGGRLNADRVVLPLFGVGRLGVDARLAAEAVVGSALDAVQKPSTRLPSLIAFLADSE
jgi:hypothetical protein